MKDFRMI